ncbi:MAG: AMP-binding protein [Alphaproteobacteria bacterium]
MSWPERDFLLGRERRWTFGALNRHANQVARFLRERDVRPGDRVVVVMPASEAYLALWFAISKVGAVEVPINPAYRGELLRHLLLTAGMKLAIVDSAFRRDFDAVNQGLPVFAEVVDASHVVYGADQIEKLSDTNLSVPAQPRRSDPACVIFTSGTTGLSKGVVMSHRHQMSFGLFFAEIVGFREDDIAYNFLPFFHIAAKFLTLGAMLSGGQMVLLPVFSRSRFWDDVREYKATLCVAVGGLCHLLNSAPETPADADNSLRLIYAVPVPWEFKESFENRFGLKFVEGFGGTESNLVAYSRLDEDTPRNSCGRVSPHFEMTIRDERGDECEPGQPGEFCVRPRHADTTMTGYLGLPEKSLEIMKDYWFHTGDRGWVDGNGYFFFMDRLKDAIRRRGENISSFEVERLLNGHPDVAECAVVPVPSELGEEEIRAVVVCREGATVDPEKLLRYAAEVMPHFMIPRFVEFRAELPRTPTLKVRKVELREQGITANTWDCEKAGFRITRDGLRKISG